ncbi:hypothetical protein RHSIM_Rhsim06G0140800 [Rhododendron simsii]|uniref:Uncharacterized protein n=1 Tax=Rhododendron simsii TaxID=118357 RepID=A0A834LIF6_RHOSS|nr:hypothetical protein RHSIM_Rhsim06G0140800 [Rhododendron simsii]
MEETPTPHAAFLSSPGIGHQIPVLELAKHLITQHNIPVTILIVTTHTSPAESHLFHPPTTTSPNLLRIVQLPPVDVSSLLDPAAAVVTQLCVMMRAAVPSVRSALLGLRPRPTSLIVDIFGSESLPVADEFRMVKYVYITTNAWFAALTCYCHVLDKEVVGQYVDQTEMLRIPGCKPVRPEDVVDPMLDRNDQQYKEYVRLGVDYSSAHGMLLNTWEDLDLLSLNALRSIVDVPVYPIGPLTRAAEPEATNTELMEWLDQQPGESVLYVSFGSGGTLSVEQLTELAWGLEMSQQRFVWVVRPPIDGQADASFFSSGNGAVSGAADFLPNGFVGEGGDQADELVEHGLEPGQGGEGGGGGGEGALEVQVADLDLGDSAGAADEGPVAGVRVGPDKFVPSKKLGFSRINLLNRFDWMGLCRIHETW